MRCFTLKHKLGIIGFGGMANWHFENCPKTGCIEPAAVYDIDPERVKMGEDKGVVGFHSLEEFLDSRLFDVVLVATPNNFHHDLSVAALRAGYHVICEKPVTMTVEELKDVFRVADACGKLFTVHQNRRWDADFNIVRKAIETGMVGKPYTIESCVHGSGGVVHGWREYKVAGGGMLYDWGIHLIDQILYMMGEEKVTDVFCHFNSIRTPEVDDYFKLILTFANHLDVQIEVGTYCLKAKPRWYVNGTEGSLILEDWDCHGSVILLPDGDGVGAGGRADQGRPDPHHGAPPEGDAGGTASARVGAGLRVGEFLSQRLRRDRRHRGADCPPRSDASGYAGGGGRLPFGRSRTFCPGRDLKKRLLGQGGCRPSCPFRL